jgi:two-component sensor histidine kinase
MARAYGSGDYSPRLDYSHAPRELRDLGETLTVMAQRVAQREEELRTSLDQKDIILREIHHRVKNNLQIVSSLLNIRAGNVTGSAEQSALSEVKAHVRALALVHRHLYENADVEYVDLRSFMTELCQSTLAGLSSPSQRVSLEIDIPEFMISTDRAIAIALLVTEAITNALKHAFRPEQRGNIRVAFMRLGDRSGTLLVADDGIGIAPGMRDAGGIGLQLIEAFAKQIGGRATISPPPGTTISVTIGDEAAETRSKTGDFRDLEFGESSAA